MVEIKRDSLATAGDEAVVARLRTEFLTRGHKVTTGTHGARALETLEARALMVALLERDLPGLSAFEILRPRWLRVGAYRCSCPGTAAYST